MMKMVKRADYKKTTDTDRVRHYIYSYCFRKVMGYAKNIYVCMNIINV